MAGAIRELRSCLFAGQFGQATAAVAIAGAMKRPPAGMSNKQQRAGQGASGGAAVKTELKRLARSAVALTVLGALGGIAACSDNPGDPCSTCPPPPQGVIVSNPVPGAALTAETRAALALAPSTGPDVVYVSLAPGTVPTGSRAIVRRVDEAVSLTMAVTDGGFDPVPVVAQVGDLIEVRVTDAGGATLFEVRVAVAAARPPVIVRTEPPPRKRDVPLNTSMVIVFSEPVNASTLTSSSVQLRRGTGLVAGTVGLLQGSATAAVFTPAEPLAPSTNYELVVTQAVRDVGGTALEADVTVQFTTGTVAQGSVASVTVAPTSAQLLIGSQSQFTATAKDAQGNELPGLPVTWRGGNPAVVAVSATGLATALAEGITTISAEIEGVVGISDASAYGLAFSVQPSDANAGVTITPAVMVRARDALGNTVTTFTGDVTLAIGANPGTGVLSGTTTVSSVAGVATFASLSINAAGIYTLTATSGLATITSAAFAVTPGPATQLAFNVQPSTTAAGAAITPVIQVTAWDALGNMATSFTGFVTIAIGANPGGGVLSGTTTVSSIAGVATFSNLQISTPGTGYTLIAAATGLASGTSSPFNITP